MNSPSPRDVHFDAGSLLPVIGELLEILGGSCLPSEIPDRVRDLVKERNYLLREKSAAQADRRC